MPLDCPPPCPDVFERVVVTNLIADSTTVLWRMSPHFTDPDPESWIFTLQVGHTANPAADDWEDVGLPAVDASYLVDSEQRVWGKTEWTNYRVKVVTPLGTYYSLPEAGLGALDRKDWLLGRSIVRRNLVAARLGWVEGFLLKRKLYGTPCPECLDPQTEEVTIPYCDVCFGSGFVGGYYPPMGCIFAALSPEAGHTEFTGGPRNVGKTVVVKATMIAVPQLHEDDVWVGRAGDRRYYVHSITNLAEIKGVPLFVSVELRPAPFSDTLYRIPIASESPSIVL